MGLHKFPAGKLATGVVTLIGDAKPGL